MTERWQIGRKVTLEQWKLFKYHECHDLRKASGQCASINQSITVNQSQRKFGHCVVDWQVANFLRLLNLRRSKCVECLGMSPLHRLPRGGRWLARKAGKRDGKWNQSQIGWAKWLPVSQSRKKWDANKQTKLLSNTHEPTSLSALPALPCLIKCPIKYRTDWQIECLPLTTNLHIVREWLDPGGDVLDALPELLEIPMHVTHRRERVLDGFYWLVGWWINLFVSSLLEW